MKFRKLVMCGAFAATTVMMSVPTAVSVSAAETVTGTTVAFESESDTVDSQSAEEDLQGTTEENKEASEWANRLLVVVEEDSNLNIRSEADTDAEVVGRLKRGDGADIVEKGEEWTKIVSGDVEGYVKNEYCLFEEDAEAQAEEICGVAATATTDGLRVRSEASVDATILHVLNEGDTIAVVVSETSETSEETENAVDDVDEQTTEDVTEAAVQVTSGQENAGISAEESVQTSADVNAEAAQTDTVADTEIAQTDADSVDDTESEWIQVEFNGTTAYVSADYVEVAVNVGEAQSMEEILKEQAEARAQAEAQSNTASQDGTSVTQGSAVSASVDDVTLLAAIIQCEAGSECYDGQLAVGAVIMNRVKSGSFPNSISGVVYQSGQFSPASSGKLASVLSSGSISASCYQAANAAIGGADNTGGALYFHAGSGNGLVIGNQVFY